MKEAGRVAGEIPRRLPNPRIAAASRSEAAKSLPPLRSALTLTLGGARSAAGGNGSSFAASWRRVRARPAPLPTNEFPGFTRERSRRRLAFATRDLPRRGLCRIDRPTRRPSSFPPGFASASALREASDAFPKTPESSRAFRFSAAGSVLSASAVRELGTGGLVNAPNALTKPNLSA